MTEEEKELKFPIEHDKCPVCGSRRRVANEVKKQEMAKKKVRENAQFALGKYKAGITDPGIITLACPIITSLIDVCVDCGCAWSPITMCEEQQVAGMMENQPGHNQPGHMPFFGKG